MADNEHTPLLPQRQPTSHPASSPRRRWREGVSVEAASPALSLQCFLSGFANTITFTATKTWTGFMTGNLVQCGLSVVTYGHITLLRAIDPARDPDDQGLLEGVYRRQADPSEETQLHEATQRLLYSGIALSCFSLGAYLSSHLASPPRFLSGYLHWTPTTRARLVLLPLLSSLLTFILAIFLFSPTPTSHPHAFLLIILSLQAGSQASTSLSLGTTPYSTTVVFTNPLTQVMSSYQFPAILWPSSDPSTASEKKKPRHQAWSILTLILGAIVAAIFIEVNPRGQAREGGTKEVEVLRWALLVLAGLQVLLAMVWTFFVPREEKAERE